MKDTIVESEPTPGAPAPVHAMRLRTLQALGIFCGFAAGAWLGGAEAPIKLVNPDISPITISLIMVLGVFLARWSVPAFIRGTAHVGNDVRQAPHLVVWAVLAGCMWAVANTLTIYAIRNVGLSIAFPLWNTNSLLGIFWGFLLFNELHYAGWKRWIGVLGGAICMFGGATLLAIASAHQAAPGKAASGILAALGAGILWGTMYIPYRKAYLTGMNPLSFITFFTVGELATMTVLAITYRGATPLWRELIGARSVLFWLMLGGFVWVLGDLFQQYATKYVGISRGIPLSNTNQLWGLLWGVLVFHELRGGTQTVYLQVAGGSLLMALGAVAIALSSATDREHASWQDAAEREGRRYSVEGEYVRAGMEGREMSASQSQAGSVRTTRSVLDWLLILVTTALFGILAAMAKLPQIDIAIGWAVVLAAAMLTLLATCGIALWRTTRFR
jgi:drug/metabolite transporter (DMT)-like permease